MDEIPEAGTLERVDFGEPVGEYVDPLTGASYKTSIGIVCYASKDAVIYPARPDDAPAPVKASELIQASIKRALTTDDPSLLAVTAAWSEEHVALRLLYSSEVTEAQQDTATLLGGRVIADLPEGYEVYTETAKMPEGEKIEDYRLDSWLYRRDAS